MRLWSLHPKYLDARGLTSLWREGILAMTILSGGTKKLKHSSQLDRFKKHPKPIAAINTYLLTILEDAVLRGYRFDSSKIQKEQYTRHKIPVSKGQIMYEFNHLLKKLKRRAPKQAKELKQLTSLSTHPLFYIVEGGIADWERPI